MDSDIRVLKGCAIVYRVFDVGNEIDLAAAERLSPSDGFLSGRLRLVSDTRKSIVIRNAPLQLNLAPEEIPLAGAAYKAEVSAKIWHYGVISIAFTLAMPEGISWRELVNLSAALEVNEEIEKAAARVRDRVAAHLAPVIIQPSNWDTAEDYVTWLVEKYEGASSPGEFLLKADVPALILAEHEHPLSESSRDVVTQNALQYSKNDMAVIDWNSALLIEPAGSRETADVIEFCLTHLLEMRYYDALIEEKLDLLYDNIEKRKGGILSNFYANLGQDSGRRYIEFSEFLGRVENSLKTVGDFYLATVFRAAMREFRFADWRQTIDRKMDTLARISQLLDEEINTRRGQVMEAIVILLIALEIIPLAHEFWK